MNISDLSWEFLLPYFSGAISSTKASSTMINLTAHKHKF